MAKAQTNKQALVRLSELGAKEKNGRYRFYKLTTRARRPFYSLARRAIKFQDGAVVEPEYGMVNRDPSAPCASGLHVFIGPPTEPYTGRGSNEILLAVSVAPEDVACVSNGSGFLGSHKVRVSKLKVIGRVNVREERKKLAKVQP